MNSDEHRYRVTREIGGLRREIYLPISAMEPRDLVNIAVPPIGIIQLTEKPNGELVGTTLPKRQYGEQRGAPQRIPTANLIPDSQGRIKVANCPPSISGYMFTSGDGSRRRGR
jgi:hypothetical protein